MNKEQKSKNKDRLQRILKQLAVTSMVATAVISVTFVILCKLFSFPMDQFQYMKNDRMSMLVQDKDGQPLRAFRGKEDSWTFWIPRDDINPHLINAIIAAEDERFYSHYGVDPISVSRAVLQNIVKMRRFSGASTLTMQLMRITGKRKRNYKAKFIEMFRALQCETSNVLSKDEILEWYLNLAPFGSNYYGIEAASLVYFDKHSKDVSLAEAALLAGLVQSPSFYRPYKYPDRAKHRRDYVLNRMFIQKMITQKQLTLALGEPILAKRHPLAFKAPHMSQMINNKYVNDIHTTTLDSRIQSLSKNALDDQLSKLSNVDNGAVVVIENKTGAIRAMVGSNGFFNNKISGQVNMATALRPPGSTLKPFVFAAAFDKGTHTPESMIADVPTNFGNYFPQNYGNVFHGPVSARRSLAHSYNIPSIKLLSQTGVKPFIQLLKQSGISSINLPASYYGLPLILGSAEVSLLELTSAYTIFPNGGKYIGYHIKRSKPHTTKTVISAEAAYMVTDILTDTTRLGGQSLWKASSKEFTFAWKTGTSYGHRVAWTVGYTPRYTVGVMIGNANNKSCKSLVGISAAAPLVARILDLIQRGKMKSFDKPSNVNTRAVCAVSGDLPTRHCTVNSTSLYINKVTHNNYCTIHQTQEKQVESVATNGTKYIRWESTPVTIWPNDLAPWFSAKTQTTAKLQITSPATGQKYIRVPDMENQKLSLKAKGSHTELFWFINDKFYGRQSASNTLLWPIQKGSHKITCTNSQGKTAVSWITVK